MTKSNHRNGQRLMAWLMAVAILVTPLSTLAQTRISYRSNRYSVSDDVRAGREAAQQVERQLPLVRDGYADNYINRIGQRLVAAIPSEFQHREFRYTFTLVNVRDVNAFALPGGPMYVNRGLVDVARNEGELAGVMAHELSHVALRHGTAQATKAQKYQYGAIAGAILGSIIGGGLGQVVGQGVQMGVGAAFLRFSREYETEADILGAQIMARAGYDPRDLANMFRTLQQQGGRSGGPEFLSSHPNPANRYARIEQEAALLRVSGDRGGNNGEFARLQSRLRGMGRAPSMEEAARSGGAGRGGRSSSNGGEAPRGRVAYPSGRFRTYSGGTLFRLGVPENWRELPNQNSVTFAPEGAYGDVQGQFVFTHGAMVGVEQAQSNNLQQATEQFIRGLAQGNRNLRQRGGYQRGSIDRREAYAMILSNVSEVTGRAELVTVYTTLLRNGGLFYMITVAPQDDNRSFEGAFQTMLRSVHLND